jgi:catechol 2,3-dioxygenase-like lactoylglutathione lyase family enzyme
MRVSNIRICRYDQTVTGEPAMGKLRHIAINVADAEKTAAFFENALGMKRVRRGGRSIHLTDGVMNVALRQIDKAGDPIGLMHFGIWVDDFASAEKKVLEAGAVCIQEPPAEREGIYEAQYRDPAGLVFDLTPSGWPGAEKEPAGR